MKQRISQLKEHPGYDKLMHWGIRLKELGMGKKEVRTFFKSECTVIRIDFVC